jgi:hypothetical protein
MAMITLFHFDFYEEEEKEEGNCEIVAINVGFFYQFQTDD